jgi:2-methylcitrate dehydratase
MLAREGMTGPSPIFEGEHGFERLVSGKLGDLRFAICDLRSGGDGAVPMIMSTSIKCWPVEYHAQSAVEAALALVGEIGDVGEIDEVVVESHDASVDIIGSAPEKWRPTTRETADHSLPYIVAAALADGQMTARQFDAHRFRDEALLALVQKVKVVRNAELSAIYPDAVANIVTVRLRTGQTLSKRVDHACGHANNPMSDAGVEEKFHRTADEVIGRDRAERVKTAARRLEEAGALGEVMRLMAVEGATG